MRGACCALRSQNADDVGLTVSVSVETRGQADGMADKLRLGAAQGTNDGKRALRIALSFVGRLIMPDDL